MDATYLDVRLGHRVVCQALVVATGVSAQGRREILGMALGDAETTDFWTPFLRSLRQRGLRVTTDQAPEGVVLVTSDAHAGIRSAVKAILPGAAWQRCTAFAALPKQHWPKIWSNNPIERLNREVKRRADVVQVFPDRQSVTRLIGSVLSEQRGVAVRRTPLPVPGLTAPPDRHAPGRQQHRRPPRPAPHHHLTGRTPHQET